MPWHCSHTWEAAWVGCGPPQFLGMDLCLVLITTARASQLLECGWTPHRTPLSVPFSHLPVPITALGLPGCRDNAVFLCDPSLSTHCRICLSRDQPAIPAAWPVLPAPSCPALAAPSVRVNQNGEGLSQCVSGSGREK